MTVGFDWTAIVPTADGHDRVVNRTLFASSGSRVSEIRDTELVEDGNSAGVLEQATWRVGGAAPEVELLLKRTAPAKYELASPTNPGRGTAAFKTDQDLAGPLVRDERVRLARATKGPFEFELPEFRPEISTMQAVAVRYVRGPYDKPDDVTLSSGNGQTVRVKTSNNGRFDSGGSENTPDFQFANAFRVGNNSVGTAYGARLDPEQARRKRLARDK